MGEIEHNTWNPTNLISIRHVRDWRYACIFVHLSISLVVMSLLLSLSLSLSPSTRPSTRVWLLVRLSFYLYILYMRSLNWQSLCPSVCPFINVCRFSIQSLQHVSVTQYILCRFDQSTARLSVCFSFCLSTYQTVCMCMSLQMSILLSVYSPVLPFFDH